MCQRRKFCTGSNSQYEKRGGIVLALIRIGYPLILGFRQEHLTKNKFPIFFPLETEGEQNIRRD